MDAARHLEILRAEGDHVAALPPEALDAPVPSIPDWTVERVVRHLCRIHLWVAATFAADPTGPPADVSTLRPVPTGPDCLPAYRQALDDLLAEFDRLGPAAPAASFIGEAVDLAWWARRQAHEVSVHRIDAQDGVHAAGGAEPDPLAVDGAADGVDEWARLFMATRWLQRHEGGVPTGLVGSTVHLHGTDHPVPADGAEWLLRFQADAIEVEATHAKGDVALRGKAEELLLVLWRRRPLDLVNVVGDRTVAEFVLEIARF